MPLVTQILRDGRELPLLWGDFHVAAMALASSFDAEHKPLSGPDAIYDTDSSFFACYPDAPFPVSQQVAFLLAGYGALSKTPLAGGSYTLTRKQYFRNLVNGASLLLLPGDVLSACRTW